MGPAELLALGVMIAQPSTRRHTTRLYAAPLTAAAFARINARAKRSTTMRRELTAEQCSIREGMREGAPEIRVNPDNERQVLYLLVNVDGAEEWLTFADFVRVNAELDPAELDAIRLLAPGETYKGGGGAQPTWSITKDERLNYWDKED
jgi:hypothetical protein